MEAETLDRDAYRIIAVCVLVSIAFGVVHNQLTARLSLEYFTVAHERLFRSDAPTLHGAAWGILATWWVGLLLGTCLAFAARGGGRPSLALRDVVPVILWIFLGTAAAAGTAAIVAWRLVLADVLQMPALLAPAISPEQHDGFTIAIWVHNTSYTVGPLLSVGGSVVLWRRRARTKEAVSA